MSSSEKKACSSFALELEGSQNLHTTSNCERLRLLGSSLLWLYKVLDLLVLVVHDFLVLHSSSTSLLFYSSNNLSVEEDPLHLTDERCSQEEDRCVKRSLRS